MSTIGSSLPSSTDRPAASTPPAISDGLDNEQTFLKLLVSQLQNQDPLSPVDSNQFVAQLTSYSQLEQLIGIHKDTTSLTQSATPAVDPTVSQSSTNQTNNITGAN